MAQLSNRLQRLAPSATLAMSQKSSEMKAQGIDVINMSVGEPDFNTPDHIKQAAKLAIDENYSRYSPVPGYPDLRQAIARKLECLQHRDGIGERWRGSHHPRSLLGELSPDGEAGRW